MSSVKDNTMLLGAVGEAEPGPGQPGQPDGGVSPPMASSDAGGIEYLTLRKECSEPCASGVIMSAATAPLPPLPPAYDQQRDVADAGTRSTRTDMPPPPPALGPDAVHTQCPHCMAGIRTTVKYTVTSRTHIAATLCCFICCCCCLPYCMDSAKNADHYCPNCLKYIGTYEK